MLLECAPSHRQSSAPGHRRRKGDHPLLLWSARAFGCARPRPQHPLLPDRFCPRVQNVYNETKGLPNKAGLSSYQHQYHRLYSHTSVIASALIRWHDHRDGAKGYTPPPSLWPVSDIACSPGQQALCSDGSNNQYDSCQLPDIECLPIDQYAEYCCDNRLQHRHDRRSSGLNLCKSNRIEQIREQAA